MTELLKNLSTEQIESLKVIYEITKNRTPKIFSTKEFIDMMPHLTYSAAIMRLQRLKSRRAIVQISRGLYVANDKIMKVIEDLFYKK